MKRILILAALLAGCDHHDDTDAPEGFSGMSLFTDHGTGCQYVGFGGGANGKALTPRIAADGKTQMGCGQRGVQP